MRHQLKAGSGFEWRIEPGAPSLSRNLRETEPALSEVKGGADFDLTRPPPLREGHEFTRALQPQTRSALAAEGRFLL
jgi:hypothetical protein